MNKQAGNPHRVQKANVITPQGESEHPHDGDRDEDIVIRTIGLPNKNSPGMNSRNRILSTRALGKRPMGGGPSQEDGMRGHKDYCQQIGDCGYHRALHDIYDYLKDIATKRAAESTKLDQKAPVQNSVSNSRTPGRSNPSHIYTSNHPIANRTRIHSTRVLTHELKPLKPSSRTQQQIIAEEQQDIRTVTTLQEARKPDIDPDKDPGLQKIPTLSAEHIKESDREVVHDRCQPRRKHDWDNFALSGNRQFEPKHTLHTDERSTRSRRSLGPGEGLQIGSWRPTPRRACYGSGPNCGSRESCRAPNNGSLQQLTTSGGEAGSS